MVLKVLLQNKSVTKAERKCALMIHWAVELIRKSCWKWSGVILIFKSEEWKTDSRTHSSSPLCCSQHTSREVGNIQGAFFCTSHCVCSMLWKWLTLDYSKKWNNKEFHTSSALIWTDSTCMAKKWNKNQWKSTKENKGNVLWIQKLFLLLYWGLLLLSFSWVPDILNAMGPLFKADLYQIHQSHRRLRSSSKSKDLMVTRGRSVARCLIWLRMWKEKQ